MLTIAGFVEPELRATSDDINLVSNVTFEGIFQVDGARYTIDQGNHVHGETCLKLCELVKVVQHNVCVGIALQRNDEFGLAAR